MVSLTCTGCGGAQHQTLTASTGLLTNNGTITTAGDSNQRSLFGDVANNGTIQINQHSTYDLGSAASATLTNNGTIAVANAKSFTTGATTTVTNATGGAINASGSGVMRIEGIFNEGAGTTPGAPVQLGSSGSLNFTGTGASSFLFAGPSGQRQPERQHRSATDGHDRRDERPKRRRDGGQRLHQRRHDRPQLLCLL